MAMAARSGVRGLEVGPNWYGVICRDLVRPTWAHTWVGTSTAGMKVRPPSVSAILYPLPLPLKDVLQQRIDVLHVVHRLADLQRLKLHYIHFPYLQTQLPGTSGYPEFVSLIRLRVQRPNIQREY